MRKTTLLLLAGISVLKKGVSHLGLGIGCFVAGGYGGIQQRLSPRWRGIRPIQARD